MFQILGAGRSGTSLLAGLIDAHPRCTVVLEDFSKRHLHTGDGAAEARISAYLAACQSAATETANLWGHKTTTEHVLAMGEAGASAFVAATTHIPCLYIMRDGRTCVPSKMRRKGATLEKAISSWKFSVHLMELFREARGPLLMLKYEELVADPTEELQRVATFLGVEYDETMLTGTTSEKMQPAYRREGFDAPTAIGPDQPWFAQIAADLAYAGY